MSPALLAVGGAVAVAMVLSRLLTRRLSVPDAIPLVVLGVVAGYLPGVPPFHIDPQIIFLGFLPALVYHAGFFTAPRETRDNAVPIALLAVGLVFATAAVLGVTVHLVLPELGWAPAFVLGAILSPTDPVAATAVLRRFGAPRRITTILEGESLVNDGVALTLFAVALHAVGRPVGAGDVVVRFVIEAAGGVAYGLVVGWVVGELRSRIKDTPAQMVVSLATPYLAYLPPTGSAPPGCWPRSAPASSSAPGGGACCRPSPGCRPPRSGTCSRSCSSPCCSCSSGWSCTPWWTASPTGRRTRWQPPRQPWWERWC